MCKRQLWQYHVSTTPSLGAEAEYLFPRAAQGQVFILLAVRSTSAQSTTQPGKESTSNSKYIQEGCRKLITVSVLRRPLPLS